MELSPKPYGDTKKPPLFNAFVIVELSADTSAGTKSKQPQNYSDNETDLYPIITSIFTREMLPSSATLAGISPETALKSIPKDIPHLCFPDPLSFKRVYSSDCGGQSYTFVLTDQHGNNSYGYCRRFTPLDVRLRFPLVHCFLSQYHLPALFPQLLEVTHVRHNIHMASLFAFLYALTTTPLPRSIAPKSTGAVGRSGGGGALHGRRSAGGALLEQQQQQISTRGLLDIRKKMNEVAAPVMLRVSIRAEVIYDVDMTLLQHHHSAANTLTNASRTTAPAAAATETVGHATEPVELSALQDTARKQYALLTQIDSTIPIPLPTEYIFPLGQSSSSFPAGEYPFDTLLNTLPRHQLLRLFSAVLSEQRILIVSSCLSTLTECALATHNLITPCEWCHLFIPLIPHRLLNYISAPMPYIIGADIQTYKALLTKPSAELGGEIVVVNLDSQSVSVIGHPLGLNDDPFNFYLPELLAEKLSSRLKKLHGRKDVTPAKVAVSFISFMVVMFSLIQWHKAWTRTPVLVNNARGEPIIDSSRLSIELSPRDSGNIFGGNTPQSTSRKSLSVNSSSSSSASSSPASMAPLSSTASRSHRRRSSAIHLSDVMYTYQLNLNGLLPEHTKDKYIVELIPFIQQVIVKTQYFRQFITEQQDRLILFYNHVTLDVDDSSSSISLPNTALPPTNSMTSRRSGKFNHFAIEDTIPEEGGNGGGDNGGLNDQSIDEFLDEITEDSVPRALQAGASSTAALHSSTPQSTSVSQHDQPYTPRFSSIRQTILGTSQPPTAATPTAGRFSSSSSIAPVAGDGTPTSQDTGEGTPSSAAAGPRGNMFLDASTARLFASSSKLSRNTLSNNQQQQQQLSTPSGSSSLVSTPSSLSIDLTSPPSSSMFSNTATGGGGAIPPTPTTKTDRLLVKQTLIEATLAKFQLAERVLAEHIKTVPQLNKLASYTSTVNRFESCLKDSYTSHSLNRSVQQYQSQLRELVRRYTCNDSLSIFNTKVLHPVFLRQDTGLCTSERYRVHQYQSIYHLIRDCHALNYTTTEWVEHPSVLFPPLFLIKSALDEQSETRHFPLDLRSQLDGAVPIVSAPTMHAQRCIRMSTFGGDHFVTYSTNPLALNSTDMITPSPHSQSKLGHRSHGSHGRSPLHAENSIGASGQQHQKTFNSLTIPEEEDEGSSPEPSTKASNTTKRQQQQQQQGGGEQSTGIVDAPQPYYPALEQLATSYRYYLSQTTPNALSGLAPILELSFDCRFLPTILEMIYERLRDKKSQRQWKHAAHTFALIDCLIERGSERVLTALSSPRFVAIVQDFINSYLHDVKNIQVIVRTLATRVCHRLQSSFAQSCSRVYQGLLDDSYFAVPIHVLQQTHSAIQQQQQQEQDRNSLVISASSSSQSSLGSSAGSSKANTGTSGAHTGVGHGTGEKGSQLSQSSTASGHGGTFANKSSVGTASSTGSTLSGRSLPSSMLLKPKAQPQPHQADSGPSAPSTASNPPSTSSSAVTTAGGGLVSSLDSSLFPASSFSVHQASGKVHIDLRDHYQQTIINRAHFSFILPFKALYQYLQQVMPPIHQPPLPPKKKSTIRPGNATSGTPGAISSLMSPKQQTAFKNALTTQQQQGGAFSTPTGKSLFSPPSSSVLPSSESAGAVPPSTEGHQSQNHPIYSIISPNPFRPHQPDLALQRTQSQQARLQRYHDQIYQHLDQIAGVYGYAHRNLQATAPIIVYYAPPREHGHTAIAEGESGGQSHPKTGTSIQGSAGHHHPGASDDSSGQGTVQPRQQQQHKATGSNVGEGNQSMLSNRLNDSLLDDSFDVNFDDQAIDMDLLSPFLNNNQSNQANQPPATPSDAKPSLRFYASPTLYDVPLTPSLQTLLSPRPGQSASGGHHGGGPTATAASTTMKRSKVFDYSSPPDPKLKANDGRHAQPITPMAPGNASSLTTAAALFSPIQSLGGGGSGNHRDYPFSPSNAGSVNALGELSSPVTQSKQKHIGTTQNASYSTFPEFCDVVDTAASASGGVTSPSGFVSPPGGGAGVVSPTDNDPLSPALTVPLTYTDTSNTPSISTLVDSQSMQMQTKSIHGEREGHRQQQGGDDDVALAHPTSGGGAVEDTAAAGPSLTLLDVDVQGNEDLFYSCFYDYNFSVLSTDTMMNVDPELLPVEYVPPTPSYQQQLQQRHDLIQQQQQQLYHYNTHNDDKQSPPVPVTPLKLPRKAAAEATVGRSGANSGNTGNNSGKTTGKGFREKFKTLKKLKLDQEVDQKDGVIPSVAGAIKAQEQSVDSSSHPSSLPPAATTTSTTAVTTTTTTAIAPALAAPVHPVGRTFDQQLQTAAPIISAQDIASQLGFAWFTPPHPSTGKSSAATYGGSGGSGMFGTTSGKSNNKKWFQ